MTRCGAERIAPAVISESMSPALTMKRPRFGRTGTSSPTAERTEQAVAERHHGVEIALHRGTKAGKLRPLIDPMQGFSRLDVGVIRGKGSADIEALLEVRLIAGID